MDEFFGLLIEIIFAIFGNQQRKNKLAKIQEEQAKQIISGEATDEDIIL